MASCPAFDPLAPVTQGLTRFVECHAQALGRDGFLALASPASPVGVALPGLLTILVALIGYRMMLGDAPRLRQLAGVTARVGLVLALSTSWPAYQTLIYDVALQAPAHMANRITAQSGLGDTSPPALAARIDGVFLRLMTIADLAEGSTPLAVSRSPAATPSPGSAMGVTASIQPLAPAQRSFPTFNEIAARGSALVLLISTMGGLLATRFAAGVLLALGPLFVAGLLLDATRGFFGSWVRALFAAALGALAAICLLSLELAVVEPQVRALSSMGPLATAGALPGQILATTGVFAVILAAALASCCRAAAGVRLASFEGRPEQGESRPPLSARSPAPPAAAPPGPPVIALPSRATALATVLGAQRRRADDALATSAGRVPNAAPDVSPTQAAIAPLGQSHRRSARRPAWTTQARRESAL